MDRIIKSSDGYIWMNVSDKAQEVFDSKLFQLQEVWFREEDNKVMRIPIDTQDDLHRAVATIGRFICIYMGRIEDSISVGFVTQDSWSAADKITHEGFTYVKFNDLKFCR
jgi:hypothetical protein